MYLLPLTYVPSPQGFRLFVFCWFFKLGFCINVFVNMHVHVYVCACVCERERDRGQNTHTYKIKFLKNKKEGLERWVSG